MPLIVQGSMFEFGGGTFVRVAGSVVRVVRGAVEVAQFDVGDQVDWIKVAPDGSQVLIFARRSTRVWRWREHASPEVFASATGTRDMVGCGFIAVDGSVLTLIEQNGALRGLADDDRERFVANLRSPHFLQVNSFVQLPGERVALLGSFFADPNDTVITVALDALLDDPEAVQRSVRAKNPLWDHAIRLAVGPCDPSSVVTMRDPEDSEVPESQADLADMGDVENFAGVYIRELNTGKLVERYPYSGAAGSAAPIVGTDQLIAIQVMYGIDIVRRPSGTVHHIPGAILDVSGRQIGHIRDGSLTEIVPLTASAPGDGDRQDYTGQQGTHGA